MREERDESTVFAPTLPADNNSMLVMAIKGMNIKKKIYDDGEKYADDDKPDNKELAPLARVLPIGELATWQ